MKRFCVHSLVIGSLTLFGANALLAAGKATSGKSRTGSSAVPSLESQFDTQMEEQFGPATLPPKTYEDPKYKIKLVTPGNWKFAGACSGSIWSILIAPGRGEVKLVRSPDGTQVMRSSLNDWIALHAGPAKPNDVNFESALETVKADVLKESPKSEFKAPLEKAKVAGLDAVVLTVVTLGKDPADAKAIQKHYLFERSGILYRAVLYTKADFLAKQTPRFDKVLKSIQFTDATNVAPKTASSATKPAATVSAAKAKLAADAAGKASGDGLD